MEEAIEAINFVGNDRQRLLKYDTSLQMRENILMEPIAVMNVERDVFSSSIIHVSLMKRLAEREEEIRELNQKKMESKKVQHLGCENEIQELKSQIFTL